MKTLFITGASGFIGRHFVGKINHKAFEKIYCLSRTGELPGFDLAAHPNIKLIKGDLLDAKSYAQYLASSDVVLHLAAVTGKAKPEEYFASNTKGTEFLVNQCEKLGVRNFIYVSSIAVKYPDISRYYYAQSKRAGEDSVRRSSLKYSIIRPTIVVGKDGPTWLNLSKLAKTPFPFVFGDGKATIQPVYVDDLVDILMSVIDEEIFSNETYDLGGPQTISFEEFIRLIHIEHSGKDDFLLHLPLNLLLKIIGIIEKYFYSLLPINTGQLSPFIYDSVAKSNPFCEPRALRMKSPKEMIRIIVEKERRDLLLNKLFQECKVFCRYLVNIEPSEYVTEKYADAHRVKNGESHFISRPFDRFLIYFSQWSILCTRLVDSYTRVFSIRSVFRKKLILLLAILESTHPFHTHIDSMDSYSRAKLLAALFVKPLFFAVYLTFSTVLLAPLHIAFGVASRFRALNNSASPKKLT